MTAVPLQTQDADYSLLIFAREQLFSLLTAQSLYVKAERLLSAQS